MRNILVLIGLAVLNPRSAVPARAPSQAEQDYIIGSRVGRCLVLQCQVFRGSFKANAGPPGDSVTVRVEELISGPSPKTGEISIPYAQFQEGNSGDGGQPLAMAWASVKVAHNTSVTIVLALESGWGVRAGLPVFITSNEKEIGTIRSLVEESSRLEHSPMQVSSSVASLSRTPNPALAGYLAVYLTWSKALSNREFSADLLSQIFGNPSVPDAAADDLVFSLLGKYHGLPAESGVRGTIVRRLTQVGQQPGRHAAVSAIQGLARLVGSDESVRTMPSETALEGLANNYRGLVKRGSIPRNPTFETGLAIKYETAR